MIRHRREGLFRRRQRVGQGDHEIKIYWSDARTQNWRWTAGR